MNEIIDSHYQSAYNCDNVHEKKMMCFWLAENECILMCSNTSANYK